jgi:hypothetical protein
MNRAEMQERIERTRKPGDCFIKWWGDDAALVDYDLLERFLTMGEAVGQVAGLELLDLEEMWSVLCDLDPDPLSRVNDGGREVIRWVWKDRGGKEHLTTFPFTPEGVMELMESEFFD